ncbi:MAG: SBBP repeat-containing protein [Chitinophagales bacterium]|nr:SBBP repeat-containing protein [Chitinophagales bacterium]MDW8274197.1 SBBP repeat-containing protein [Chitinophagales bacterium]
MRYATDAYRRMNFRLYLIVVLILQNKFILSQSFIWATASGGIGNDVGTAVVNDKEGNIYITGNISGSGFFQDSFVTGTVFEVFLAKYNPSGNLIWVKTYGGLRNEKAHAMCLTDDAIYLCGYFEDTAQFGNTRLVSAGGYDVFVLKTDLNGNTLWARKAGGPRQDIAYGITADPTGNVYVCGSFSETINIQQQQLTTVNPFTESFLFSLDKDGNVRWAKNSIGNNNNSAMSIAWNKIDGLSVCGFFGRNFTWDNNQIVSQTTSYDYFVATFDTSGSLVWLTGFGSAAEDQALAVTCDESGNTLITGYTGGILYLNGKPLDFFGWNDVFVAKYNRNGSLVWITQAGGPKLDLGTCITTDKNGNIYVSGMFENSCRFTNDTIYDADRGIFIAVFDSLGKVLLAQSAGDIQTDAAMGISVFGNHVYVTGYYLFKCRFGLFEMPYADFFNIFLAAYALPSFNSVTDFAENVIKIFPNPTDDILFIEAQKPGSIKIMNATGQILYTQNMRDAELLSIEAIKKIPIGIYFLLFNNGEKEFVYKFVKH